MRNIALFSTLILLMSGCLQQDKSISGIVLIQPTINGEAVSGIITFSPVENGLSIKGSVSNLTPGQHGFHIHEYGDLSAPDGTSAGGHYNPLDHPHSSPEMDMRHTGDLGNITAGEDGIARIDLIDPHGSISGKTGILGRAVVIHADPDDLKTQPTGNAGKRVGVGVIGIKKSH